MEAPPDLPALCFDLQEVYEQFEDFLVFQDMIGKKIVALGGWIQYREIFLFK